MINIWRRIDTLPNGHEPFVAAKSIEDGRRNGGVLMRRSLNPRHEFEQFVSGDWHPAVFRNPQYWIRQAADVQVVG